VGGSSGAGGRTKGHLPEKRPLRVFIDNSWRVVDGVEVACRGSRKAVDEPVEELIL